MKILGTGSSLPENEVTNKMLSAVIDTNDEWISSRTGIRSRRTASGDTTLSLAVEASRKALAAAGVDPKDISLVICATATTEHLTPALACLVSRDLGLRERVLAFDLNAACTGFIYSLIVASRMLCGGEFALIIGSEVLSRVVDYGDRSTAVLFGDGAGAVVLRHSDDEFFHVAGARGDGEALLIGSVPPAKNPFASPFEPPPPFIRMDGQEVFRFAVGAMSRSIADVLKTAGVDAGDVDHFVCHQANRRIIESAAKRLKTPVEKFFINIENRGNTSAASIPIALDELNSTGALKRGDRVVLAGFGGGLTYGAVYMVW
ncbi:MAG: ketoacyl-ACP synthase III [Clostridiales bacterium]|nr:ketoacyl-ACP synthase III [Clostridiales bacterium]